MARLAKVLDISAGLPGVWPGLGTLPEWQEYRFDLSPETPSMSISAINARNQFKGTVKEIIRGPVLSEVDVLTQAGIVTSVLTSRSIDELNIRVGDEVLTVFKSTEVLLAKLGA